MIAMGLKVNFENVKSSGILTIKLGMLLFSITSVTMFIIIYMFI